MTPEDITCAIDVGTSMLLAHGEIDQDKLNDLITEHGATAGPDELKKMARQLYVFARNLDIKIAKRNAKEQRRLERKRS